MLNEKTEIVVGKGMKQILNVGLNDLGLFVALREDDTAEVFQVPDDATDSAKIVFEFAESVRT